MNNEAYLIGEIGQNHNGSVDIAKLIVESLSWPIEDKLFDLKLKNFNAIKLTKRDLKHELSKSQMESIYDSPNSFGKTYGEHRKFLELDDEQHFEVYKYAKLKGFDFIETLCSPNCLSLLRLFKPDKLKVASRDLTNLPLLEALSETKIPIILSTGMSDKSELDSALNIILKQHSNISILHCVSEYPTNPKNLNLLTIPYLIKNYPENVIGFSDHTIGISSALAAFTLGAKIIEKHVTIDRRMKGTDQNGSLAIEGTRKFVRDLRLLEYSFGTEDIFCSDSVKESKIKLERSIATKKKIHRGEIIKIEDLTLLSPGSGLKWNQKDLLIGKIAKRDIDFNEIIFQKDVE